MNKQLTCPECDHEYSDSHIGEVKCPNCLTVSTIRLVDELTNNRSIIVKPTPKRQYKPTPKLGVIYRSDTDKEYIDAPIYCINCCELVDTLTSVRAKMLRGYHPIKRYPLIKTGRACLSCIPALEEHGREHGIDSVLPDVFNNGLSTEFKAPERADHSTLGLGMSHHLFTAKHPLPYTENDGRCAICGEVETHDCHHELTTELALTVEGQRKKALEIARSKKPAKLIT